MKNRRGWLGLSLFLGASLWVKADPKLQNEAGKWFFQQQQRALEPSVQMKTAVDLPSWSKKFNHLSKKQADALKGQLWVAYGKAMQLVYPESVRFKVHRNEDGAIEGAPSTIKAAGEEMLFHLLSKGDKPEAGWPLFIALHGGGRTPGVGRHGSPVNNREWQAQQMLASQVYPGPALFMIPRMPNDEHGRWWWDYTQDMYHQFLRQAVALYQVNPNRIYLIGISEGGYATYRLAPFWADKFAGVAAMAAGDQPWTCPAENLANLPFYTAVGANDHMFKRREFAEKFHAYLDKLKASGLGDYENAVDVQPGRGHGIDYKPAPTKAYSHIREIWPQTFQWLQYALHGRVRTDFYWLEAPVIAEEERRLYQVRVDALKQIIDIRVHAVKQGDDTLDLTPIESGQLSLRLSDELLNLDRPILVRVNGEVCFKGRVKRNLATMLETLQQYGDPERIASAKLKIQFGQ